MTAHESLGVYIAEGIDTTAAAALPALAGAPFGADLGALAGEDLAAAFALLSFPLCGGGWGALFSLARLAGADFGALLSLTLAGAFAFAPGFVPPADLPALSLTFGLTAFPLTDFGFTDLVLERTFADFEPDFAFALLLVPLLLEASVRFGALFGFALFLVARFVFAMRRGERASAGLVKARVGVRSSDRFLSRTARVFVFRPIFCVFVLARALRWAVSAATCRTQEIEHGNEQHDEECVNNHEARRKEPLDEVGRGLRQPRWLD